MRLLSFIDTNGQLLKDIIIDFLQNSLVSYEYTSSKSWMELFSFHIESCFDFTEKAMDSTMFLPAMVKF